MIMYNYHKLLFWTTEEADKTGLSSAHFAADIAVDALEIISWLTNRDLLMKEVTFKVESLKPSYEGWDE